MGAGREEVNEMGGKKKGKAYLKGGVSGYLLYRSNWTTSKNVARDLRTVADLIDGEPNTEWFILPVDSEGREAESRDDVNDYIITYL